jgi:cob(I)alamin adenosyltransferase
MEQIREVLEELQSKRDMRHVVITGRNAKEEIMDLADLVTAMRLIQHPEQGRHQGPMGRGVLT